jgi:hypothetical protein
MTMARMVLSRFQCVQLMFAPPYCGQTDKGNTQ